MATKLLQFKTSEGEVLIAAPVAEHMVQPTGRLEDTIEVLNESLDEAMQVVVGVGDSFGKVFEKLKVDAADLELGLQFTAKGSVYVVEATGQASLKIKLSFRHAAGA